MVAQQVCNRSRILPSFHFGLRSSILRSYCRTIFDPLGFSSHLSHVASQDSKEALSHVSGKELSGAPRPLSQYWPPAIDVAGNVQGAEPYTGF
jgi:hypothetical protein